MLNHLDLDIMVLLKHIYLAHKLLKLKWMDTHGLVITAITFILEHRKVLEALGF